MFKNGLFTLFLSLLLPAAMAELPTDPFQMVVKQRSTTTIRGLEPVRLYVGDITAGQVSISAGVDSVNDVLTATSVRSGEVLNLRWRDQTYYIRVLRLHNALIGEDFAELAVSTQHPHQEEPPPAAEQPMEI